MEYFSEDKPDRQRNRHGDGVMNPRFTVFGRLLLGEIGQGQAAKVDEFKNMEGTEASDGVEASKEGEIQERIDESHAGGRAITMIAADLCQTGGGGAEGREQFDIPSTHLRDEKPHDPEPRADAKAHHALGETGRGEPQDRGIGVNPDENAGHDIGSIHRE